MGQVTAPLPPSVTRTPLLQQTGPLSLRAPPQKKTTDRASFSPFFSSEWDFLIASVHCDPSPFPFHYSCRTPQTVAHFFLCGHRIQWKFGPVSDYENDCRPPAVAVVASCFPTFSLHFFFCLSALLALSPYCFCREANVSIQLFHGGAHSIGLVTFLLSLRAHLSCSTDMHRCAISLIITSRLAAVFIWFESFSVDQPPESNGKKATKWRR